MKKGMWGVLTDKIEKGSEKGVSQQMEGKMIKHKLRIRKQQSWKLTCLLV